MHIAEIKQETQLRMKVETELNILNTAIIDHNRFLYSGTSLTLKVIQGDTVHCVQNNILAGGDRCSKKVL